MDELWRGGEEEEEENFSYFLIVRRLEGLNPYGGGHLLAPAEGWWPMATWEGPSGPDNEII